MQENIGKKRL